MILTHFGLKWRRCFGEDNRDIAQLMQRGVAHIDLGIRPSAARRGRRPTMPGHFRKEYGDDSL
jgi:hypothetical protein